MDMRILIQGTLTLLLSMFCSGEVFSQNTYYHDGLGSPNALSSWWSSYDFTGSHPGAFNGGDSFLFVHGNHLVSFGNWNFSGSGTVLRVGQGSHLTLGGDLSLGNGSQLYLSENALLETDTFSVSGLGDLKIENSALKIASLHSTVPELEGNYFIQSGRLELCGAGDQELRGSRSYDTVKFSGSCGVKTFSSAITGSNTLNCIVLAGNDTIDAANRTIGSSLTNFVQSSGLYRCEGTGTKPDAGGDYSISGGCIEFAGESQTNQTIRNGIRFNCVQISGTSVSTSSGNINLDSNGVFQVQEGAVWNMSNPNVGIDGYAGARVEVFGDFLVNHERGFIGGTQTSVRGGIDSIYLGPNSRVIYMKEGNQVVSDFNYSSLVLAGSGVKSGLAIGIQDSLIIIDTVRYDGNEPLFNSGATLKYANSVANFRRIVGQEWPDTSIAPSVIIQTDYSSDLELNAPRTIKGKFEILDGRLVVDSSKLTIDATCTGDGFLKSNGHSELDISGNGILHFDTSGENWSRWTVALNDSSWLEIDGNPKVSQWLRLTGGNIVVSDTLSFLIDEGRSAQLIREGGNILGVVGMQMPVNYSGWSYVSSPLQLKLSDWQNQKQLNFSGASQNIFKWDATASSWSSDIDSNDEFAGTQAYAIRFDPSDSGKVFSFFGEINRGNLFNSSLDYDGSGDTSEFISPINIDGWNLIGNPYSSHLNWNKVNLDGSINPYYYVFHPGIAGYVAHNGSIGHSELSGNVPPFQAFFVKLGSASDTSSLAFHFDSTNGVNGTQDLYKNDLPSVWISLTDQSGHGKIGICRVENSGYEFKANRNALIPGGLGSVYWWDDSGIRSMIREYPDLYRPVPFRIEVQGQSAVGIQLESNWDQPGVFFVALNQDTLFFEGRNHRVQIPQEWNKRILYFGLKRTKQLTSSRAMEKEKLEITSSKKELRCGSCDLSKADLFSLSGELISVKVSKSAIYWEGLTPGIYVLHFQDGQFSSQLVYHP